MGEVRSTNLISPHNAQNTAVKLSDLIQAPNTYRTSFELTYYISTIELGNFILRMPPKN